MDMNEVHPLFVAEIQGKNEPFEIAFRPITLVQLYGLLQLAMRHPQVPESHREVFEQFKAMVRAYFDDCPTTLGILERGDNPDFDVTIQDEIWRTRN
jgi:hypothetical protein